ncbi:hypothetical protein FB567DRAFT_519251 [Paraphoma chrysanthemicola]|uniref:Uncharacterized protein n=1 Tax=Paraphoma chrysanthemicola TaxID=798071 RepID=A0A8K0RAJ0_9PLEO|nr:hypothetical protein FB567DRAFT_519251 [Paraphoma chrysanthemicola]
MTTPADRTNDNSARAHSPTPQSLVTGDILPPAAPPIPSYEAATTVAPPITAPAILQDVGLVDELPDYTPVDSNQTTFMIYGTFIHTPNGPAYHLSSLLDAHISKLRIRRLKAEDIALIEAGRVRNVSFDYASTLYEAHDPPFLENEYYIQSKAAGGWPGALQLRFGFKRWHVRQMMPQGVVPAPMLTCGKTGGLKNKIIERRNETEPSEWKDTQGRVLATEVLRLEEGKMLPTIELSKELDQTWRELLLALWVSRLWAGFGAGS